MTVSLRGVSREFPMPFGGIDTAVMCSSADELTLAVGVLVGCPQPHHFAVAKDDKILYTSQAGAKCVLGLKH